jgi:hypothetical protein
MSGAEIPLVLAIAGGASSAYAGYAQGQAQAKAKEQDAALKRAQADELMDRFQRNETLMRARNVKLVKGAEAYSGGRGAGSQDTALAISEFRTELEGSVQDARREAEFKARMLRQGADMDVELASDIVTGSYWKAGSSILSSGYDIYSTLKPAKTQTKDLFRPTKQESADFLEGKY